jgi:hypothetical protein
MTALHVVLGVAVVVVNLAAGALGGWRWHRGELSRAFWPLLRAGQALVVVEALDGGVLLLLGRELPRLHLIYGLVPLGVAFIAEQLRLTSAQAVLDARGVATARELPEADQDATVIDILLREMGVMAASALVVAALGLRAGGVL